MVHPEFRNIVFFEYMYAIFVGYIGVFVDWSGLQIYSITGFMYNICCGLVFNMMDV